METCRTKFKLTAYKKVGGPLSKTIAMSEAGEPVSDSTDCRMSAGTACSLSVEGMHGLAEVINDMSSESAISLGTIKDLPDGSCVDVVTKKVLEDRPGCIARSRDFLGFEKNEPGLLLIDFDQKGMPEEVNEHIKRAGGCWKLICEVMPALASAGHLRRGSTSAGLANSETGEEFPGTGGEHIYVAVQDASDIPRATKALHKRLWLAGLGWMRLGKVGQMLERSIVDQSVGSPERLIFEGPPVLEAPLTQSTEAREPLAIEGSLLNTGSAIPNLSAQEKARFNSMLVVKKNELKPKAEILRDKADERLSKKLAKKTNVSVEEARKWIALRHEGKLAPLHPLQFDDSDLGTVSVGDVLNDPERFVNQTLADPLEGVSYGRNKAIVYQRRDGSLWIKSFAHGGARYDLIHHAQTIRSLIAALDTGVSVEPVIGAIANAHLELGQEGLLLRDVKSATGVRMAELRSLMEGMRRQRSTRQNSFNNDEEFGDYRVSLPSPESHSELTPVIAQIDEVLRSVELPVPPFRTLNHQLARVSRRPLSGLHQLASEGEDAVDAPSSAVLTNTDDAGTLLCIEKHICFVASRNDGSETPRRLQQFFARGYAGWEDSNLPRVRGISSLPMVLRGDKLKFGSGLDQKLGLIFDIDENLSDALESIGEVNLDAAKQAYDWLCNNWLVDLDTDRQGKAVIIALALTVIQRHLLEEAPAFFVTAAQRGSGKTTVLNMVAMATSGTRASAASWSFDDEERRKGIFSFLREGAPMVVYDNIPRGSALNCPTLERVLTSGEIQDRILGESRSETVPATSIIAFTGNNVGPKSDLASRSLIAFLSTDRPDPENRSFVHDDPIGWTQSHRVEILRCLFSILMLDRDSPDRAKSRFKRWWRMVGHPLELVANVDFDELFRNNDKFDEEAQGAREFIVLMLQYLSDRRCDHREFSAAEIGDLIDDKRIDRGNGRADHRKLNPGELRSALEEASGRPFTNGKVSAHRVARKLKSIEGRPVEVNGRVHQLTIIRDHERNRYRIDPKD